jgi:hypothetical protein
MKTPFEKLYLETIQLEKRYLRTLSAHKTYLALDKTNMIPVQGKKKALDNTKVLNKYWYFFSTAKEATRCYFLIELAKFFDTHPDTRSIFWMLEYADKHMNQLTKQDYIKFHSTRNTNSILFEHFKPLERTDILRLQKRINLHSEKIKKLKDYRDQELAHDDRKKKKINLTIKEMDTLLKIVRDVVKLFYAKLDFASIIFDNFEKEPGRNVVALFNFLNGLEKGRNRE